MKDLETTKPWKTFGRSSVCLVFKRLLAMTFWIRILAFCVGKMFVKLAFSLCISLLGALRYIRRTQKCRGQNDSWLVFPCLINFDSCWKMNLFHKNSAVRGSCRSDQIPLVLLTRGIVDGTLYFWRSEIYNSAVSY